MASKQKKTYREISVIQAELEAARARAEREPENEVIRRVVERLEREQGRYTYREFGMHWPIIVTCEHVRQFENAEIVPLRDGGRRGWVPTLFNEFLEMRERGEIRMRRR